MLAPGANADQFREFLNGESVHRDLIQTATAYSQPTLMRR
jgi:hypothetical protein